MSLKVHPLLESDPKEWEEWVDAMFRQLSAREVTTEVNDALEHATPEHLAKLADVFSARTDPAFKAALTGVAWAAAGPGRLSSANIDSLTKLAGAFTKIDLDLNDDDVATAVEAVAMEVAARGDDLLPQANIEQIATLAGAFWGHDDSDFQDPSNFNDAMAALALQVTARGDALLPQASAEQLATMKAAFGGPDILELGYPGAFVKVDEETKKRERDFSGPIISALTILEM